MPLNRYGKPAVALLCAAALFAVGFAVGSDGHVQRPGPKRTSARNGAAPAIDSLGNVRAIPSLHESKSRKGASPAPSSRAAPSAANAGSVAGSGAPSGVAAGSTTPPPANEPPPPARRNGTE